MLGMGEGQLARQRVIELECEVAELRDRLTDWPVKRVEFADRATVVRAIRAVSQARGQQDTAAALRHLGNCAYSWADRIDVGPGVDRRVVKALDRSLRTAA
jgi:hypothetical protein